MAVQRRGTTGIAAVRSAAARVALAVTACLAAAAGAPATEHPDCIVMPFDLDEGGARRGHVQPLGISRGVSNVIVPSAGNVHLLVILAEFSDVPARLPASRFNTHLFGSDLTLRDYFRDLSGGALSLTGDVHGWVTLPQTEAYYSGGAGGGGIGAYPQNGQKLAEDAVDRAIQAGLDLRNYDRNGDRAVDALLVIHSGQGYEWASSPALTPEPDPFAINSHKWVVTDGNFGAGLPLVVDYFTCPELQLVNSSLVPEWNDTIATIGVYCHEFGHMLGLPDFYDTQTFDNRVGMWDLMDYGTWNRVAGDAARAAPGALPGGFSAWCRMYLGWETPLEFSPLPGQAEADSLSLQSASTGGRAIQLLANPHGVDWSPTSPGAGEFFVAEVRTRTGWDAGLPSEGLLVYHVDESRGTNRASDYPDGGGLVVLQPEDGDLALGTRTGDPWPGVQTTFGPASNPSSDLYAGGASGVTIRDITTVLGGSVDLAVTVSNLTSPLPLPYASPNPWRPGQSKRDVDIYLSVTNPVPVGTRIGIWNALGRRVRTLDTSSLDASGKIATWNLLAENGAPVATGMYFFRVGNGVSGTGKVLVLR